MSEPDFLTRAHDLTDGFFIGGTGDSLEQPNITKGDLAFSIAAALRGAYVAGLERAADVTTRAGTYTQQSAEIEAAIRAEAARLGGEGTA